MKLRPLFPYALPALALSFALMTAPAQAEPAIQLASPVVELIPVVKQQAGSLNLSQEQKAKLDKWVAEAPAKRKALENEQIELRGKLRAAVLTLNSEDERKQLIEKIAENEEKLMTMRARCVDFLRELLTVEQFDKVVAAYKAK